MVRVKIKWGLVKGAQDIGEEPLMSGVEYC
jgi:hypothetical protein